MTASSTYSAQGNFEDVQRFATRTQRMVWIAGLMLGIPFTWYQFQPFSLTTILAIVDPTFLRRFILWIYYFCWVAGLTFDIHLQREIYSRDPQLGNIPLRGVAAFLALLVIALVIFFSSEYSEKFAATAMAVLLVVNILGWKILLGRVNPIIRASRDLYLQNRDFFSLEQLNAIARYLQGNWQWYRFFGMLLIIGCMIAVSFSGYAHDLVDATLHQVLRDEDAVRASRLVPAALLALFVVFAETWVWFLRNKVRTSLNVIHGLKHHYKIEPY